MKKHFLKIFLLFVFFLCPVVVKANFGDLRYEVTDVNIKGSKITFEGWAFIHRTNNFITVGDDIRNNGDQKVIMEAYVGNKKIDIQSNFLNENDMDNYNFYCELFYKTEGVVCTKNNYESAIRNSCENDSSGVAKKSSQCYYEDINFRISFDISKWNVDSLTDITFKIAASNSDFESKIGSSSNKFYYNGDYYTVPEIVSISDAAVSNTSNDYIEIIEDSLATDVEFIASNSILRDYKNASSYFRYPSNLTDASVIYGTWQDGRYYQGCSSNIYQLISSSNYPEGRSRYASSCSGNSFLGSDCKGTYYYSIKIDKKPINSGSVYAIACPGDTNYYVAVARGSHIKPTGAFKINVKSDKKCAIDSPDLEHLYCNNSSNLSSTCKELTVNTDKGSAIVKIEQKGNISSILTPDTLYAGGGFKFGIMYYGSIKWSYVGNVPDRVLHDAVTSAMNKKIKDYNSYVADINITEVNLGGKSFSGLVKKCTTSSNNKDYYNKELVVSCTFAFPDSVLKFNGNVEYSDLSNSSFNINNKYYTPLDYNGEYKVNAKIVGIDRINSNASRGDSETGKSWTGDWSYSFEDCSINLYSLFYKNGKYNFIYRPIDINNPFPNRNAGFNWFMWYNINSNRERLENSYSNIQYTTILNNENISSIKKYNENNNYLNWVGIDENSEESLFITENNFIDRVGGSS